MQAKGFDFNEFLKGQGGNIGNLISQIGGQRNDQWKNPAGPANELLGTIPPELQHYYAPFINAGLGALPQLQGEYGKLLNAPGQKLNAIGADYQKSPGFDFALKQALQAAKQGAAAGGYAGSPAHEQYAMQQATGLANQDYNNWLGQATGLYGKGLGGTEHMYDVGATQSADLAKMIADVIAKQSELAYKGTQGQNEHDAGKSSGIWDAIGNLAGGFVGGGGIGDLLKLIPGLGLI
jgi:hypothetical protein